MKLEMECWLIMTVQLMMVLMSSAFKGPFEWMETFSMCAPDDTRHQSSIRFSHRVIKNDTAPPLDFTGFNVAQHIWTVAKIRDTIVVAFEKGMSVSGAWLAHEYQILEMRFHLGSRTGQGSGHTSDKCRFLIEMQIVGIAPGFPSAKAALDVQSGLLMIGVFIDIGDTVNGAFTAISDVIPSLKYPGPSVNLTPPALIDLMPPVSSQFYFYHGGETSLPCCQSVDWIVFEEPILIFRDQYLLFLTSLLDTDQNDSPHKLLMNNIRSVQSSYEGHFTPPCATEDTEDVFEFWFKLFNPLFFIVLVLTVLLVIYFCINL